MDPNPTEAWKGVIDFAKTVFGVGSALLAAIASYLLVGGHKLEGAEWVPPGLLVASMLLCLYGFGGAIQALRSGKTSTRSLGCTNISVVALLLAIVLAPLLIRFEGDIASVDSALKAIESDTRQWHAQLSARNCRRLERSGDDLLLTYEDGGQGIQVRYSATKKQVIQIR